MGIVFVGCASGYGSFYTSMPPETLQAVAANRLSSPPKRPDLDHSNGKFSEVVDTYGRKGFVTIGYSSFSSGTAENDQGAMQQAIKVGADVVVVINPQYVGSVSSSVPLTTPTSTTSYTNSTATAYGSSGSATAYGNSTTTTYGTQTTYIPITVDRYDYGAVFFVKRRFAFGANWRDLNDLERRNMQTNKGVYILYVVEGAPAYEADVLSGDIVLAVNGQSVNGSAGFQGLLESNRSSKVELTIVRNGKTISKSVALGN
jgi:hypothetical protein